MSKRHITGFYFETLLLIVVFMAVILVLTGVFGLGRAQSGEARLLTNAVRLAENAAEAVSASDSEQALLALLDEGGNAAVREDAGVTVVRAFYDTDMTPDADGALRVDVTWQPVRDGAGELVSSTITVFAAGEDEPVYAMDTAVFLREVDE